MGLKTLQHRLVNIVHLVELIELLNTQDLSIDKP